MAAGLKNSSKSKPTNGSLVSFLASSPSVSHMLVPIMHASLYLSLGGTKEGKE